VLFIVLLLLLRGAGAVYTTLAAGPNFGILFRVVEQVQRLSPIEVGKPGEIRVARYVAQFAEGRVMAVVARKYKSRITS